MIFGKVVDNMTQESCIPTDSVKSDDDHLNLVHNTGVGVCTDSDKTNPVYLVGLIISESKEVDVKYGSLYALE